MRIAVIPYEEVVGRHPRQVEAIVGRLRRGKSKHKAALAETLTWNYDTAVRIEGSGSILDMIAGRADDLQRQAASMTLDERVLDEVRRTSTTLEGRIGHWYGRELVPNPPEVEASVRQHQQRRMNEQAAFDALPEAEKKRQLDDTLRQLRGTPGFVEVRVPLRRS